MTIPQPTSLDQDGFQIVHGVVTTRTVSEVLAALPAANHALRNLLDLPVIRALADGAAVRAIIDPILGPDAKPVRGLFFDKTPGANWKVAWHQDRSIAVRERRDTSGFGPWSVKAGVVHVQPPREILERMLTLRLHLDPCDATNGPLRVVPGSHRLGILSPPDVEQRVDDGPILTCEVPAGGALLMRPLLLHASSAAAQPAHRRVIHIEFSPDPLPSGLAWHSA